MKCAALFLALLGSAAAFAPAPKVWGVALRQSAKMNFKVTLKNPEGDAVSSQDHVIFCGNLSSLITKKMELIKNVFYLKLE
jgi:hypothetical protein